MSYKQRRGRQKMTYNKACTLYESSDWNNVENYQVEFIRRFDPDEKVKTSPHFRFMSPVQVFKHIITPDIVNAIIDINPNIWDEQRIQNSMSSEDFFSFVKTLCFVIGENPNIWEKFLWKQFDMPLSRRKFMFLKNNLRMPDGIIELLMERINFTVSDVGSSVTVDELFDQFRGDSPSIKYIPRKPGDGRGHLVWTLCGSLEKTERAIVLAFLPWYGTSVNTLDIVCSLLGHLSRACDPVVTMDSYFLSKELFSWLNREKWMYIASVSKLRWEYIWKILSHDRVKKVNDWGYMEHLHEEVIAYCQRGDEKIFNLMTNAYNKEDIKKPGMPPLAHDYRATFNHCDRFNRQVSEIKYPFRVDHYLSKFTILFIRMIIVNCCNLYNEHHCDQQMSLINFVRDLGSNL